MEAARNRDKICGNCKHYSAYCDVAGFCSEMAKYSVEANRNTASKACKDFDPLTGHLPPIPDDPMTWYEYLPNIPEGLPFYGGKILVRYVIINQDGKKVGHDYRVLKTPFDGYLPIFKKTFPYDKFDNYIPTHFAYINDSRL